MPKENSADFKLLPKVELHRHLEGALRLETVRELAMQLGIELPPTPEAQREKILVLRPMQNLTEVLDRFWLTQSVLASSEILERITFEACEDAYREGIRILELRYAPSFIQINHPSLNFESIHAAIIKGIDRAKWSYPMAIGLIGIVVRVDSPDVAERTADFIIDHKDEFMAIDLAGDEAGYPCEVFEPLFMKAKKAGLRITVHAGEADVPGSAKFVVDAINYLGAERIGHGLQIYKDQKIIDFVKACGVTLEICPTSNWLTNAVRSLEDHPLKQLMDKGVKVTLNSDDPGLFGIDLTHEYGLAARRLGFSEVALKKLAQQGADSSFVSEHEKRKVWNLN
jgi:adenosine deaminase